ncbi:MAG: ferredoxin [Comamonas sp.]
MYVILTSKPGQYITHANADIELLQAWDYVFYGRRKAQFVIGRILRETKVRVADDSGGGQDNWVPSKFLERFDTLEGANAELAHLCNFGSLDAKLVEVALTATESRSA